MGGMQSAEQQFEPQWFVARLKTGDIDRTLAGLEHKAIHAVYPQAKMSDGLEPVLRGYLFVCLDPCDDEFSKVTETPGIDRLLPVSNRPCYVPQSYMDDFFARLGAGEFDEKVEPLVKPLPWFKKSETLEIMSGPFCGHTCTFKHVKKGSVIVEVKFFGQALEVALKGHQVQQLS